MGYFGVQKNLENGITFHFFGKYFGDCLEPLTIVFFIVSKKSDVPACTFPLLFSLTSKRPRFPIAVNMGRRYYYLAPDQVSILQFSVPVTHSKE